LFPAIDNPDTTFYPASDVEASFLLEIELSPTLTLEKTVTGNLSDPNKAFDFTLYLNDKLPTPGTYPYEIYDVNTGEVKRKGTITAQGDLSTPALAKVKLAHNERLRVLGLHQGAEYRFVEDDQSPSGYTTGFTHTDAANTKTTHNASRDTTAATENGGKTLEVAPGNTTQPGMVDQHVRFTNTKENTPPTGLQLHPGAYLLLAALLLAGLVALGAARRKRRPPLGEEER
ncbi:MAG: hypothetical protein PHO10_01110, partial [Gemmiger sp.]|nr:hypothetical protein [Gemmiger sp.]